MKSKLNGKNKVITINTWECQCLGLEQVLYWENEELKALDRITRKVLTMNDFIYFPCKERC